MLRLGNRGFRTVATVLFLAAFLAGQAGTPVHYGNCRMADVPEPTEAVHPHGQHPPGTPQSDDTGCDCKGPHCCPPAAFPQPAASGRSPIASVVVGTNVPGPAAERLPSPIARGPVAARAPPGLL
jgi:hypothetical protein